MKFYSLPTEIMIRRFDNVAIKCLVIMVLTVFSIANTYSQDQLIDSDADGIPDQYEVEGSSWDGLPLYEWGARPGVKDIFIEIDYMDPYGPDGDYDRGLVPMESALIYIGAIFQDFADSFKDLPNGELYSVKLHFDVGDLYDQSPGTNPERFDLGGGNQVSYAHTVSLDGSADKDVIADYYNNPLYFDPNRKKIFHYMLFANKTPNGGSGQALYRGPVSTVTLGQLHVSGLTLRSRQAKTIIHELGHNLGLRHTPTVGKDFSIVYFSVMNYYYLFKGYFSGANKTALSNGEIILQAPHCEPTMVVGPVNADGPGGWFFSTISMVSLDENYFSEFLIDADCNGVIDSSSYFTMDLDGDGELTYQTGSNDYENLYFYFSDPNRALAEDSELALELAMPPF